MTKQALEICKGRKALSISEVGQLFFSVQRKKKEMRGE
jgi:hypothetical protein